MNVKRGHGETPKTDRPPLKLLKPNLLNSPRVIAAGVLKDKNPVMNCSFENVTPVSKEQKQKIKKLVELMDNVKAQIPAHEDFIEKCKEEHDDYQVVTEYYQKTENYFLKVKDDPIVVQNIEPCVPIKAKDILDNFVKQKLKIEEPNTELEEELILLTRRHEKLSSTNNSLSADISKLLEEFEREIEICDKKLEILDHF